MRAVVGHESGALLFARIAANNLFAGTLLVLGLYTAGVSAVAALIVNGFKIARLLVLLQTSGATAFDIVAMLGLHGVIEFPVLIIAGAFGLQGYQRFVIAFVSRDRGAK